MVVVAVSEGGGFEAGLRCRVEAVMPTVTTEDCCQYIALTVAYIIIYIIMRTITYRIIYVIIRCNQTSFNVIYLYILNVSVCGELQDGGSGDDAAEYPWWGVLAAYVDEAWLPVCSVALVTDRDAVATKACATQ